jgi:hypothetical protein
VETPQELERVEAQHVCPEKALADLLAHGALPHPHVHPN